ncbi:glycosyl hydrolase family 28-related protein [Amycolatopsis sp. NPDC024027]|uniref:glycosyl hydrolase family 28-related protein n=1 Tax=Amycolatopsis sp. NPDC024027 TaxID=3154327 RepID=UPI0033D423B5
MTGKCASVADFGAKGDGVTDDRPYLQAAIDACKARGINRLFVPCGIYLISRTVSEGIGVGLDLSDVHGLTIVGEGPDASVLKMTKTFDKGWRLIRPRDASEVVFRDLTLDGNWSGETGFAEHIHLTEVTSQKTDTSDVYFDNVWFRNCCGDGFRTIGNTSGLFVRRSHARNCRFLNVKRAPVSGQRGSIDCSVTHCYIESVTDSAVDFEPSALGPPSDTPDPSPTRWDISHNTIVHNPSAGAGFAVSLVGLRSPGMEDTGFCFNKVIGGSVQIRNCRGIKVIGNSVVSRTTGPKRQTPTLQITLSTDVHIAGNTFTRPRGAAAGNVLLVGTDASAGNDGVLITGNCLHQYTEADIVQIASARNVVATANTLRYYGAAVGEHRGFFGTTTVPGVPLSNVKFTDNDVVGDAGGGSLARGVFVNSRESQVGPVDVRGNGGSGMVIGAEFRGGVDAPGFTAQPICHGNTWLLSDVAYAGAFGQCPGLEAIIVATSGKRVTYEGVGAPENNVTGNVGDEFHQTDGVAGTLRHVKETGAGTTAGWVAVR